MFFTEILFVALQKIFWDEDNSGREGFSLIWLFKIIIIIIIIIISCIGLVPINFDMDILRADTVRGSYSATSQQNLPSWC